VQVLSYLYKTSLFRVLILILYSTVYSYWVFLVVVLHWITMMLWVLSRYATIKVFFTQLFTILTSLNPYIKH
jgi:hypothetical protein